MDNKLKEKLSTMVNEYKTEETTNEIRKERNSKKIYDNVQKMLILKQKYARIEKNNSEQFKKMAISQCNFLFTNFTNIFNRLLKNEIDLNILFKMVQVLEKIENGELDQHEGSYMVGTILKNLYIDSALRKEAKRNNKKKSKKLKKPIQTKKISWNDFKKSSNYKNNI